MGDLLVLTEFYALPFVFRHTTLAIVVDLSKPSEIWFTLETLLAAAKARIENILTDMKQEYPGLKDKLRKKAWERVGEEHSVRNMKFYMEPFQTQQNTPFTLTYNI